MIAEVLTIGDELLGLLGDWALGEHHQSERLSVASGRCSTCGKADVAQNRLWDRLIEVPPN